MKLPHHFVQRPRDARHGLRTHRFAGQRGHHPAHLPSRDAAQKRLPDQQRDILGAALKLGHHLGQKTPLASPRHAQPQGAELGYEVSCVVPVAVVLALGRAHVAPAHHVQIALPLAQSVEKLLRRLLRPRLQIAPKTFPQILYKMLEMLADWDYLRHGCKPPFWSGFCLSGQSQLTPSRFYTIEFTSPTTLACPLGLGC